ncbi:unnamed protein product [Phytophthora lilii]|uniref:Unnamed protein product n=1 Tax=Phytophthora lilii TaxID=2077276 RepID=A0A9W6UET7_9STRA|nr:unnamed protein product [Phytophthora lilii]
MQFHRRLGHLNYDTIVKIAKDPASGIALTDHKRDNCLTCAQGKQTKNAQSRKDTGVNSPIDGIGGVICSDLKGTMTPRDRLGNRYMVNFVDHRTNYCRIFLARPRTWRRGRSSTLWLFSSASSIAASTCCARTAEESTRLWTSSARRPVSLARSRNKASNGKAECMHRTIMNMVFACGLALSFWGDAAGYAARILN